MLSENPFYLRDTYDLAEYNYNIWKPKNYSFFDLMSIIPEVRDMYMDAMIKSNSINPTLKQFFDKIDYNKTNDERMLDFGLDAQQYYECGTEISETDRGNYLIQLKEKLMKNQ